MSQIKALEAIPDVSFIGDTTLQQVQETMLRDYVSEYSRITGKSVELAPADPMRLVLQATSLLLYQALQGVERAGRQNLLKYAEGGALDNLAALRNCTRLPAQKATTTLQFTINPQPVIVNIPGGTRVVTESGVYFATTEYVEIPAGAQTADVPAVALIEGDAGNGIPAGTAMEIVDPLPYLTGAINTVQTAGGSNVETDDELTERVFRAPGAFSVAGPAAGYEYFARRFRSDIADVKVFSPAPEQVTVLFLLDGGALPNGSDLQAMEDYLSDGAIRPLCDRVTAAAPAEQDYSIDLTYYINRSDRARADAVQAAVGQAVESYKSWQRTLGRDVNASELIQRVMAAGAKRVEIRKPAFASVDENKIARLASQEVVYGGLEDD
ncbi:baseplate assembly protein [Intestinibacillus massiliensis]